MKTYVDQEEFSVPKMLFGILFSIVWAYALAFVYGVLIAICPIVYLNLFITGGFGLLLSFGVAVISRGIKNTSRKVNMTMGVVAAFFGLYFSWAAYFLYVGDSDQIFVNYFQHFYLVSQPILLIEGIIEANEYGLWEMFGIQFKGTVLWIVWLLEAGIIFFLCLVSTSKKIVMPFSSKHNRWYKKYILYKDFASIVMQYDFCNALANDCENVIKGMELGRASNFARVSVYYLEEENQQYLSVENVVKDAEGKKEEAEPVIHLLCITKKEAENLIREYHAKKASFISTVM